MALILSTHVLEHQLEIPTLFVSYLYHEITLEAVSELVCKCPLNLTLTERSYNRPAEPA